MCKLMSPVVKKSKMLRIGVCCRRSEQFGFRSLLCHDWTWGLELTNSAEIHARSNSSANAVCQCAVWWWSKSAQVQREYPCPDEVLTAKATGQHLLWSKQLYSIEDFFLDVSPQMLIGLAHLLLSMHRVYRVSAGNTSELCQEHCSSKRNHKASWQLKYLVSLIIRKHGEGIYNNWVEYVHACFPP